MIDIVGLYNNLLSASIAGLPFEVLDTREEFGRRVQRFLFPGIDQPVFQDMAVTDGPISVTGMLIGDDYVQQAANLRFLLRQPGPFTLVHPWLGNLSVVLSGPSAVSIALTNSELRIARFTVSLYVYEAPPPALADTLSGIAGAVTATLADAQAWMAAVIAPAILPLEAFSYAQGWLRSLSAGFAGLVNKGASGAQIGAMASPAIAALSVPAVAPTPAAAAAIAANVAAVPGAIVAAAQPGVPSAVAPGGPVVVAVAADPADATSMLLQAVPIATQGATNPAPGPALAASLQAIIVANAVAASALIAYQSVQQAQAQALVLMAALDAAIVAAATAAQTSPQLAAPVWDDLIGLKAALAADTNALIGRLPAVVTVNTINVLPAWLIAHYVAGDVPARMAATYADIVARNRVINPALVPAGALEVLQVA